MAKHELLDLSMLMDNVVSDDINEYSITLFGEGGSGKSALANALKRRLGSSASFFFEPRAKGLGGIKVVECLKWEIFLGYIKQLKKLAKDGKKVPFNNIIIDSVDSAYEKCTKYVMEENDWDTLQGDYGARYATVGDEFKGAIDELRNLGFIVTFLTHEKTTEAHDVNDAAYDKAAPIIASQIQGLVSDQVDFIMYLQKVTKEDDDGNKKEYRRLWIKNNPYITLKTPLFGMPDYIEYENVQEGVDKFIKAFNEGVAITRKMADDGEDISTVDSDNMKAVEFESPKVTKFDDDDFDDIDDEDLDDIEEDSSEDDEREEPTIDELQSTVEKIRDNMVKELDGDKVKVARALRKALGTAKVRECDDAEKLFAFIKEHE